jgi:hypothetical protein
MDFSERLAEAEKRRDDLAQWRRRNRLMLTAERIASGQEHLISDEDMHEFREELSGRQPEVP